MSICKVATEKETMLIESNAVAYAEASKAAIESFIGFRESYSGKDLKMYNKTYDLFYNFFDRNALTIHATTVPQAFIDNIKKYSLKSTSNLGVMNPDTINYSANAMVGIYNRTKKILTRIEKNKGNVGKFAGMLRDPFMVGLLADSGGVMNKLIDHVQAFGDRRDQRFLTQVNNIGDAKEIFKSKLEDIFSQKFDDDRINDYIADGLDGFVTHNGDKVTILKVSETMRGNGEDTQLTVRYNTGIKKRKTETIGVTFAPEHRFTDRWRKNKPSRVGVLMKKNVAEQLKNALKNKYSNTITSEIKNGQIRYIEAGSNPSKEDLAVITRMLKEESIRYDNKDTKKFGYFHKIERNGWTIEYVMVKQPEGKEGKEVYKAYITSKVLTAKIDEKDSGKYYFYNRHIKSKAKNDYDYVQSRDFSGHKSLKELGILDDGYYRSKKQDEFGTAINNQYSLINGSVNKQWVGFNKINSKTFSDIVSMPSFWDAIRIYRNEMKTVPDIVRNSYRDNVIRNQKTKKYLDSVVDKSGKIKELITKLGADNLNAYTLYDLKENYFPNMPDRENRQKMLMAEVEFLEDKLKT
jgi:hypothetical protein